MTDGLSWRNPTHQIVQRGELLPSWRRPDYMGRAVAYNDRGPKSWMHHSTREVYAAMVNLNATKARDIYFNHSHEIWPHLFRTQANPQEGLEVGALTREGYATSQLRWRVTNVSKHVDVGGDRYPAMLGVHVLEPLNSIGHKKSGTRWMLSGIHVGRHFRVMYTLQESPRVSGWTLCDGPSI